MAKGTSNNNGERRKLNVLKKMKVLSHGTVYYAEQGSSSFLSS